jgi:hypothetical protein
VASGVPLIVQRLRPQERQAMYFCEDASRLPGERRNL